MRALLEGRLITVASSKVFVFCCYAALLRTCTHWRSHAAENSGASHDRIMLIAVLQINCKASVARRQTGVIPCPEARMASGRS